jgi:hypothetical protein
MTGWGVSADTKNAVIARNKIAFSREPEGCGGTQKRGLGSCFTAAQMRYPNGEIKKGASRALLFFVDEAD